MLQYNIYNNPHHNHNHNNQIYNVHGVKTMPNWRCRQLLDGQRWIV